MKVSEAIALLQCMSPDDNLVVDYGFPVGHRPRYEEWSEPRWVGVMRREQSLLRKKLNKQKKRQRARTGRH